MCPEKLLFITAPWLFSQWGIDLVSPFLPGKGGVKHIVFTVEYFTKWVETEPLETITAKTITRFLWKNIVYRFDIPNSIVFDNGK